MTFDAEELAKQASILIEEDHPNSNPDLQAMVGDPDDTSVSTFAQFKPNPGTTQVPDPNSPVEGDFFFAAYLIAGAAFEDKNGQQWTITEYLDQDNIQIENRWYPRVCPRVTVQNIRQSIYAWIEPVYQVISAVPDGVDYGVQRVKMVKDNK